MYDSPELEQYLMNQSRAPESRLSTHYGKGFLRQRPVVYNVEDPRSSTLRNQQALSSSDVLSCSSSEGSTLSYSIPSSHIHPGECLRSIKDFGTRGDKTVFRNPY